MDVAVIKGIKLVPIRLRRVGRQGEQAEIGFGHADLPVAVVRFVISHGGRDGDLADHILRSVEPGIPLVMILAVVDEVAHRDDELGVGMSLPGRVQRGGPYAVVAGL